MVIHALADQQSLNRMGGLGHVTPLANAGVLVGCLAIAGIALLGVLQQGRDPRRGVQRGDLGVVLGVVGIAGALTAFYMFRLAEPSGARHEGGWDVAHPHRPGWAMSVPVVLLAIGATFIGWLQVPGGWQLVDDWLEPALTAAPDVEVSGLGPGASSRSSASP